MKKTCVIRDSETRICFDLKDLFNLSGTSLSGIVTCVSNWGFYKKSHMQCESLTFSWTHALRSGPESFASFCKRRICCCPTKNPCYLDILINLYRSLLNSACARRRLRRAVPLCLDPPGSPFNFFKTDPDSHRIWWSLTSFKRIFQKFCSVSGECIGLPPGSFIFSFKSSTSGYLGWWKLLAPQHHHCHDVFALLY